MALYRHFEGMPALEAALVNHVLRGAGVLDHATPELVPYLVETFARVHACLVEYPALVPLLCTEAGLEYAAVVVADAVLGRLRAGGLDEARSVEAFHALLAFAIGSANLGVGRARARSSKPPSLDGLPHVRASLRGLSHLGEPASARAVLDRLARTYAPGRG